MSSAGLLPAPAPRAAFCLPGTSVGLSVVRGDATQLVADVGIAGRINAFRGAQQSSNMAWLDTQVPLVHRRVSIVDGPPGTCWRSACILHYQPKSSLLSAPWQLMLKVPTHASQLAEDLLNLLLWLSLRRGVRSMAMLPLSCRNAEVVAAASVAAVVNLGFSSQSKPLRIAFCDLDDATPFLKYLQDRDHCLKKFLNQWRGPWLEPMPVRVLEREMSKYTLSLCGQRTATGRD